MLKRADKTYHHIRPLALFIATVLCLCLVSCSSGNDTPGGEPDPILTINILAPAEQEGSLTRADVGTVPALENENRIYHIWVWAFLTGDTNGDNAVPVGSLYQELGGVLSTTCQMSISPDVVSGDKNLDIYVVANSEAIPSASFYMGHNVTLGTIKNLVFGKATNGTEQHDDFGITTLQHTVPDGKGLPMSQYALGCEVIKASKLSKDVNITLRRAVSKLRFVFARSTGLPGVQVTGFTLDGGLIPNKEYVFPDNTDSRTPNIKTSAGYDETPLTFTQTLDTDDILQHDNPKSLGWNGSESGEEYTDRLKEAFGTYTSSLYYGLTYLRETGKKLTGTIRYKLSDAADATEYTAPFEMAAEGDFTRNHEYIVYAYFKKSGMGLTVTVQDWDRNDINHEFANTVAVAEGGKIRWTDGTYNQIMAEKYVIMYPNINIHPTFTFNIQSPKGATWYAVLRTLEGDPMAFTLCDLNGNVMEQGIVDNNPITLCVHAREPNPAQNNVAELLFVVRCNGQIIPVTVLTDFDGNYVIVQNKNI